MSILHSPSTERADSFAGTRQWPSRESLLRIAVICPGAGTAVSGGRSRSEVSSASSPRTRADSARSARPSTPPASAVHHWLRSRAARAPAPGPDPRHASRPRPEEMRVRREPPPSAYPAAETRQNSLRGSQLRDKAASRIREGLLGRSCRANRRGMDSTPPRKPPLELLWPTWHPRP